MQIKKLLASMGTRKMASDILIWIFGIIAVISLFLALKKRYIINVGDLTQEGFDKLVIPFKQPLEEHIKEKLEPLQEQLDNEINKFKLQVNKSLDKATELKKQIETCGLVIKDHDSSNQFHYELRNFKELS